MTDIEKLAERYQGSLSTERRPVTQTALSLCTNDDINKLIRELSRLLNIFVSELDKK